MSPFPNTRTNGTSLVALVVFMCFICPPFSRQVFLDRSVVRDCRTPSTNQPPDNPDNPRCRQLNKQSISKTSKKFHFHTFPFLCFSVWVFTFCSHPGSSVHAQHSLGADSNTLHRFILGLYLAQVLHLIFCGFSRCKCTAYIVFASVHFCVLSSALFLR